MNKKIVITFCFFALMISLFIGYNYQKNKNLRSYVASRDKAALLEIFDDNHFWLTTNPLLDRAHKTFELQLDNACPLETDDDSQILKTIVYHDKGITKGFVSYYIISPKKGRILYIAVDKKYRGKGYAEKLLTCAIQKLEDEGIETIELTTRIINRKAQNLYKKLQFYPKNSVDELVIFERKKPDSLLMKIVNAIPISFLLLLGMRYLIYKKN